MTTEPNSTYSGSLSNLAAGQKLAGCYSLDRWLDVGGGHLIWIARDEVLGKQVSLHFLPSIIARDAAAIDALRLEVKRNRPLIHPGVLRVYDLVEGEDWTAVAMESFEGRCLAEILAEAGRFEVEDVEPWLDQVCVTLEEAHRIKLTHRDLSPENIFVTPAGHLLLANFGLGRVVQDALQKAGAEARLHTLSPQLLGGAAPVVTDDVYGVGALFFELLAGRPIFEGEDLAEKIRHAIPPRISVIRDQAKDHGKTVQPGWENVIAACLNKRADERPNRPSEIVSSIEAYLPVIEPSRNQGAEIGSPAGEQTPTESAPLKEEVEPEIHVPEPHVEALPPITAETFVSAEPEEHFKPIERATADIEPLVAVETAVEFEPVASIDEPTQEPNEAESTSAPLAVMPEPEASVPEPEPTALVSEKTPEPESKPFTPRPVKYYDTEEDAFSSFLPKRFRFPAAVAAAVVFLLLLINGFFKGAKEKSGTLVIATTDAADRSELTSVKNALGGTPGVPTKVTPDAAPSIPSPTPPVPLAVQKAPSKPEMIVAAGPTPSLPPVIASAPAVSKAPATTDKDIANKAAAVERLKQDLANAEREQQARAKEQQMSAAALAEAQKAIEDKMKAATAAKKVSDELMGARKKKEEDQLAAETAAKAAQQLALEKSRAAEDARKALADFEAQNREKLATQDKLTAEIQALQQTVTERQKAADAIAKAAATADTARQRQIATLQQTEKELAQAKDSIAKASADEDRRRQAVSAERQKLDDEIASMRALFEQKMKDIEDRRRQIDTAPSVAPATRQALAPTAELKPAPAPTPVPTLPLMALKTDLPKVPATTPVPVVPAPAPTTASSSVNSVGLRFSTVGDVQFSVWQTRVRDFETFAKAVNLKSTAWRGPGFRQGPDHPVVNVTWSEAIAFCKWLTDKEHKDGVLSANQFYRLPYDLEWSKAVGLPDETGKTAEARDMGVPDVYPWGTDWPPPKGAGNYTGEETGSDVAIKGYDDGFAWTAPVGSFPPNKLGLYDMGGNVWQWCMDSWNNESKAKVLRGASWYNGALKLSLLSSCRVHASPDSSTDNYGFRIVRATETIAAKSGKR